MQNFKPPYNYNKFNSKDHFIDYISRTEIKLNPKETVKKLLEIKNYFLELNDENSVKLINKIIGNTRCHKNIVFVSDGSYRNERIWIFNNTLHVDLSKKFSKSKTWMFSATYDYTESEKYLKYIIHNFEKIFIQLPFYFYNKGFLNYHPRLREDYHF